MPRLELTAALLSCRIGKLVKSEFEIPNIPETYWVDSKIILGYMNNDSKRFRIFVANRTRQIRNLTTKEQWRYVNTKDNPGDDATREISIEEGTKVV